MRDTEFEREILKNQEEPVEFIPITSGGFKNILSLEEINKQAKDWAKERSVGNRRQDEDCEYDFKCGMLAGRSFLSKK